MPSMPRCQEMSRSWIQVVFSTIWKPASPVSKATRMATVSAPVATENSVATSRADSTRRLDTSAVTSAPMAGSTTAAVRSGKSGDARPRRRASQHGAPDGEDRDEHDRAEGDTERVGAHVAGLEPAGTAADRPHQRSRRR